MSATSPELTLPSGQRVVVLRENLVRYDRASSLDGKAPVAFVAVWVDNLSNEDVGSVR